MNWIVVAVRRPSMMGTVRAPELPQSEGFPWPETAGRVLRLLDAGPLVPDATGRWYEQREGEALVAALRPPLVLLEDGALPAATALVERADEGPGRYAVLLMQAGAASLGLFQDGELLDHKAMKRYVVRGKGKAQPTHLKTRGKSRFGSRLRLRNAERLLVDVVERLGSWTEDDEAPERLFVSCPVRLFADLCRTEAAPDLLTDEARHVRIPIDVNVPTHTELVRVHRSISRGREWSAS
ncbi:MAG: hypothetical protein QNJ98_17740 [Planctomycetota bacterium]|nr:hypothetical protein [Planctomycetota bacterium]